MILVDIIAVAVIVLIIGAASAYIVKAKKNGKKCIGCPDSCRCCSNGNKTDCGSCTSCRNSDSEK